MAQDSHAARPPSPPHSDNGHYAQAEDIQTPAPVYAKPEPYTPPMPAVSYVMTPQQEYDPYGDPSLFHTAPTQMYYPQQQAMVTSMPSHSPPQNIGVLTRSARAMGTPSSIADTESSRASQSPKARRKLKKKAGNKKGGPVINQPLSVLTQDYQTPVRDMEKWVTRPVEVRMEEVEKKKGYVSRPMNSFMLYRSAFAERVKQFCKENNHQVVSQVTGASWPLEPKEIRTKYEQYAIMERDNHAAAHPNYKFAPNKAVKRARNDDDSDSDPEWEGSMKGSKRSRSVRRFDSRSASSTPFDDRPPAYHQRMMPIQQHLSTYEMHNPYGQMAVASHGMVERYYQPAPAMDPYEQVSDLPYRRIEEAYPSYQSNMGLVGLPHTEHHDLLTTYPLQQQMAVSVQHGMLDPRLEQVDPNYQFNYYEERLEPAHATPRTIAYDSRPQLEMGYASEEYHPGLATLTAEHDEWEDPANAGADFDTALQSLRQ